MQGDLNQRLENLTLFRDNSVIKLFPIPYSLASTHTIRLFQQKQELQQTKIDIENTIIRSPINGIVQTLELRNSQQVLQSGEILAYISPTQSPLVVKALVSHGDISRVKIGQEAQIRIESCPYPDYGVAKGSVTAIAPDASSPNSNPNTDLNPSTSAVYDVTIQLPRLILETSSKSCTLQAGMQGKSDIITEQETLLSFLLRKMRLIADI